MEEYTEKADSQSGDATSQFQFIYELLTSDFEQLLRNLSQKSEQIQIRTNQRKLILYPTIQVVNVIL